MSKIGHAELRVILPLTQVSAVSDDPTGSSAWQHDACARATRVALRMQVTAADGHGVRRAVVFMVKAGWKPARTLCPAQ